MPFFFHPQSHLNSQPPSFSFHAQQRDHAKGGEEALLGHRKLLPLPQTPLTLLKSSEVALISFHVLFRSWIQMQKNSSKDLSWVKNIGWKSLQVSLAGGKRREKREEVEKGNQKTWPHPPKGDDGRHVQLKPPRKKGTEKRQPEASPHETSKFKVRWSDLSLCTYFD